MKNLSIEEYIKEASLLLKNKSICQVKSFFYFYCLALINTKVELKEWRNFTCDKNIDLVKAEAINKINKEFFSSWEIKSEDYELIKWHKNYTNQYREEDVLGRIYLIYSKNINRKIMGEHYTREDLVNYILTQINFENFNSKKIIDPCCGSGNFLIGILKLAIKECRDKKEIKQLIKNIFSYNFIVGIDIQEIPYMICGIRILLMIFMSFEHLEPNDQLPILQIDSLKDNTILLQDQYDLVITNPPYLRYQLINITDREIFMKKYISATGRFDLYVIFIEKCIRLAKFEGNVVIVTSDKFMSAGYGNNIRNLISLENRLIKVQDLRNMFAFEASVLSAIYYIKKIKNDNNFTIWEEIREEQGVFKAVPKGNIVMGDTWRYINLIAMDLLEKIMNIENMNKISDLCSISIGIQTTADSVFSEKIKEGKFKREKIEEKLLYPLLRGKTIKKWKIGEVTDRILYPYIEVEDKMQIANLNSFHYARKYLLKHKQLLKKRNYMGNKAWYEHLSPKNFKLLKEIKIVTPDLSSKCQFALDTNGLFCNGTVYFIKYNVERCYDDYLYLLALLNSNLIEFVHKNINTVHLTSNKYRFQTNTMKNYPIILLDKNIVEYRRITSLVRAILEKDDSDISKIEDEINVLVYRIYKLNDRDISIIEEFLVANVNKSS